MIDHYTTGVDLVLVEYTSQISLQKICSIHFSSEDIKINISSKVSDHTKEPVPRSMVECAEGAQRVWSGDLNNNYRDVMLTRALPHSLRGFPQRQLLHR